MTKNQLKKIIIEEINRTEDKLWIIDSLNNLIESYKHDSIDLIQLEDGINSMFEYYKKERKND